MVNLQRSLAETEGDYRYGLITKEELDEYLEAWNNTTFRFTEAYWQDGAIRQRTRKD